MAIRSQTNHTTVKAWLPCDNFLFRLFKKFL